MRICIKYLSTCPSLFPLKWKISCQPMKQSLRYCLGFKASYLRQVSPSMTPRTESHAAKCFHVKIRANCQCWWRIEWVCHRENAIIWLTVNVILFHLFSCPEKPITHGFIYTVHQMCLLCSVCLNGVTSGRVQGIKVQQFFWFLSVNWIPYMPFFFVFYKNWEWISPEQSFYMDFFFIFCICLFNFNVQIMLINHLKRSLEMFT